MINTSHEKISEVKETNFCDLSNILSQGWNEFVFSSFDEMKQWKPYHKMLKVQKCGEVPVRRVEKNKTIDRLKTNKKHCNSLLLNSRVSQSQE